MTTVDVDVERDTYTELTVDHPPTAVTRGIRHALEDLDVVMEYADTDDGVRAVTGPRFGAQGFEVELLVSAWDDERTRVRVATGEQSPSHSSGYSDYSNMKPTSDVHDPVVIAIRDALDPTRLPERGALSKRVEDPHDLYHPDDRSRLAPAGLMVAGFLASILLYPVAGALAFVLLFVGFALAAAFGLYEIRQIRR
jgi:hypothetical protein